METHVPFFYISQHMTYKLLAMNEGATRPRSPLLQIVNSVMLTIIAVFLGYLTDSISDIGNQQETLNIAIAVMNQRFESHTEMTTAQRIASEYRITNLEEGSVIATADRITKTEALEAIDNLRNWVEQYYERKDE